MSKETIFHSPSKHHVKSCSALALVPIMLEARSGTFTPQLLKSSVTSDRKLPRLAMFQTTSQLLIATMMNAIRIIHKRFKFAPSFLFPSSQQVEWEEKEEQKDKKKDSFIGFDAEVN